MPQTSKDNSQDFLNPYKVVHEFGLKNGMSVADFGAGGGHFTVPMARAVGSDGHVYVIDIRPAALEILTSHKKLEGLMQIKPIRSDLETPNGSTLAPDSQDLVFCSNLLNQVEHPDNVIAEAYRVLKNGGKLIVIDWFKDALIGPSRRLPKKILKLVHKKPVFQKTVNLMPVWPTTG